MRGPLLLTQPLDLDDAREAARQMSVQRRNTEQMLEEQNKTAADAEHAYRKAFAIAFVHAEGTAAAREAIARAQSADEARERDIEERIWRVLLERLRGLEGERSMLKSLMEWSARLNAMGVE